MEFYEGTLISDHEAALIKHGSKHQECLSHVKRYSIGAAEIDPDKTWHRELTDWITRAIEYRNDAVSGEFPWNKQKAREYIDKLKEILLLAEEEYEYEPPTKYQMDGYNLFKRMNENFDDYVLFLRDPSVEPTNNISERQARKFKRKPHQVMSFRSQRGVEYFCDGLSITESVKARGENLYDSITQRFNMT